MSGPIILIVTSRYYAQVAAELEAGVADALSAAGARFEFLEVPGAFEVPGAITMAAEARTHDGFVALGCVIRGETSHYDLICTEVARGIMDISLSGVPVAFGVLTVETEEQAMVRASRTGKNKGQEIAAAVLRMIELSKGFGEIESE
ncbi:MAG: 6,7-dimethyl-8-ribityllumazine synthase [Alphaproteobacteria bacterium]|nr:6,7-dimethyl-8-ribityllumazine synthase [Alphaproteobacteria bacterium]